MRPVVGLMRRPETRRTISSSGTCDAERGGDRAPVLLERLVERLGLDDGAREAVEQEAVARVVLLEALDDDPDDHVVGHELAGVHEALGLGAQRAAVLDGQAQDVAGRDVREAELVADALGLRALAGAGRARAGSG